MHIIHLTGGKDIPVGDADFIRIEKEWKEKASKIAVGNLWVKHGDIKRLERESAAKKTYDLNDLGDKATVKEFEKQVDAAEQWPLPHPIEWYGKPYVKDEKYPDFVFNPMLGSCTGRR